MSENPTSESTKQDRLAWILGGILTLLLLCGLVTAGVLWQLGNMMQPGGSLLEATLEAQRAAMMTQRAAQPTAAPPETPTVPPATPTDTPEPTATPTFVLTVTPSGTLTPALSPTPGGCTLAARFVQDVTVPDGSVFAPGETFTKTWRLLNVGTCTWTTAFVVYFVSGHPLGAPKQVNLPYPVEPGRLVDISVPMKAPKKPGTYESYWKLRSDSGQSFGVGPDANTAFWVKIKVVKNTPPPPTPTPTP